MHATSFEEAQAMLALYKERNHSLYEALCTIHKYVDATDAQLAEEQVSRQDILRKAREMKYEYDRKLFVGMIIQDTANAED